MDLGTCVCGAQSPGAFPERHKDGGATAAQAGERRRDGDNNGGVAAGDGAGHHEGDICGDFSAAACRLHVSEHVQDHVRVDHLRLRHAPFRRR